MVALFLAAMLQWAALLAVCPTLHELIHHDADDEHHDCAVTLFLAGQVEQAFHTEMHHYAVGGVRHLANSTDISIPSSLGEVVAGIGREPAEQHAGTKDISRLLFQLSMRRCHQQSSLAAQLFDF